MSRFVFFYAVKEEPEEIRDAVPAHVSYWKDLELNDYVGGPFADHSGGLICFSAATVADAEEAVSNDPFVVKKLILHS